jgi:hypothetical protein
VVFGKGFKLDRQSLARQLSVAAKGGDKPFRWLRRIPQRIKKSIPISTGENHALMLSEHSASSLVSKVARGKTGDFHRSLDERLCRGTYAQLNALAFDLGARLPTI